MSKGTHALTYGVAHAAAPVDMTERTRVGSHVRANMHDDVPTIVHVNSHTGVLLLPYMHSHVNSGLQLKNKLLVRRAATRVGGPRLE